MKKLFILLSILLLFIGCSPKPKTSTKQDKKTKIEDSSFQKGMSYSAFSTSLLEKSEVDEDLEQMKKDNVTWIALIPIWYQENSTAIIMKPDEEMTPSDKSVISFIKKAKKKGLKIMLKPYIDSHDEVWRAAFTPTSWDKWFKNYTKFILHYAYIAEKNDVEQFSIGCEYTSSETHVSNWETVIKKIRENFSGKLTYAADWSEEVEEDGESFKGGYKNVKFWDKLDYIGIDAYFSLAQNNNPTKKEIQNSWQDWLKEITEVAEKYDKKVIFTEIGYESIDGSLQNPGWWEYDDAKLDLEEQKLGFEELFSMINKEKDLIKGTYVWWWDNSTTDDEGSLTDRHYTPRNKPAEKVMRSWYSKLN